MEYRTLPHGKEKISILGLGTSSIQTSTEKEIEDTIRFAVENGINYFDMASSEAKPFPVYGRALADCRKKVYFQQCGSRVWTSDRGDRRQWPREIQRRGRYRFCHIRAPLFWGARD